MPVYPLDGGHVSLFPHPARPVEWNAHLLWISVITGGTLAVFGLVFMGSVYMGLLFGLLAFQSFQMLQALGRY
ncbi:MAG: hypothetical protein IPG44_18645 [Anaerolineales bacterium]|nr:hypothetical protein [Anaerolineales bacterium]